MSSRADQCFEWPGASGPLSVRLYHAGVRSTGLLVFFPPGGFARADLDMADDCAKDFALACGVSVLTATHALAPAHPFPAAIEDAHAVLRVAARRRHTLQGWTGGHLLVGGIEAGGNLAAAAAMMSRDRAGPNLSGQILMMPMLDPSMRRCPETAAADALALSSPRHQQALQSLALAYRDYLPRGVDRMHPYACPLESTRLAGLPPALLIGLRGDPLSAAACTYSRRLEAAGVAVQRRLLDPPDAAGGDERCIAAAQPACVAAVTDFLAACLQRPAGALNHSSARTTTP